MQIRFADELLDPDFDDQTPAICRSSISIWFVAAAMLTSCMTTPSVKDVHTLEQQGDVPSLVQVLLSQLSGGKRSKQIEVIRARDEAARALARLGHKAVPRLVLALKNSDPEGRARVAMVLAEIKPSGAAALASWAEANPKQVTKRIAEALSKTGLKEALPPLVKVFENFMGRSEFGEAAAVLRYMGMTGRPEAADILSDLWPRLDFSKLKAAALQGLGAGYSETGFRLASTALADPDSEVRKAAAQALGRMGGKGIEAVVRLFFSNRELDRQLGIEGVLAAGPKASLTLVYWMGPVAHIDLDVLVRLADAVAVAMRNREGIGHVQSRLGKVVQVLARGLPDTAAALLSAFRKNNPGLRRTAALVLGLLQSIEAVPTLAHVVVEDPDPSVRSQAVTALALICDECSVVVDMCRAAREKGRGEDVFTGNEIEKRITRSSSSSKLRCDRRTAMANCRGVALPALAAAARDPSKAVKLATAKALVQLTLGGDLRKDPLLADTLKLLAKSEDEEIRFEAQQGARSLDGL